MKRINKEKKIIKIKRIWIKRVGLGDRMGNSVGNRDGMARIRWMGPKRYK